MASSRHSSGGRDDLESDDLIVHRLLLFNLVPRFRPEFLFPIGFREVWISVELQVSFQGLGDVQFVNEGRGVLP